MVRRISIFGSTGSIGRNTVSLVAGRSDLRTVAISGASNIGLLAAQARRLRAEIAVTGDTARLADLRDALAGSGIEAAAGPEALLEAASRPVDWAMSAIVGAAGLPVSLALARQGGTLALANKESLVCAGILLRDECAKAGTRLLPVDSEHSAIFQALNGERREEVERIILTASGGPFRDWTRARMATATVAEAVAHPNWSMGQRISIDSATLFNKAMELIETKELFSFPEDRIEVVVHPQSIIHSMVGFHDGSIIAQLGPPDMKGAIGYALNFPKRLNLPVERLDFKVLSEFSFHEVDDERFPAIGIARDVAAIGGLAGAAFNAAKEAALDAFISRQIGFLQMADLVEEALTRSSGRLANGRESYALPDVLAIDRDVRQIGAGIAAEMAIEA
ncbi:MAG: 1-deoxy-D-xylulose-5-phosphate reductoisomerase [Paracoccaceae bacterium]